MTKRLIDRIEELENKLEEKENPPDEKKKKTKTLKIKLPSFKIRKAKSRKAKKEGKPLCVVLGANKQVNVKVGEIRNGNVVVDGLAYEYDPNAVYHYKKNTVIFLIEWRDLPLGGVSEEHKYSLLGGEEDRELTDKYGLNTRSQKVIIREIQNAQVEGEKPKAGGMKMVWIIIGIVIVIYLISKMFGG